MIDLSSLNDFALLSIKLSADRQIEGARQTIERCVNMREAGKAVAKGHEVVSIDPKGKRKSKPVPRSYYTWRSTGSSPYDIIERAEQVPPAVIAEFQARYDNDAYKIMGRVARKRRALMLSYGPQPVDKPIAPKKKSRKKEKPQPATKKLI